jgi:hypothetical protein
MNPCRLSAGEEDSSKEDVSLFLFLCSVKNEARLYFNNDWVKGRQYSVPHLKRSGSVLIHALLRDGMAAIPGPISTSYFLGYFMIPALVKYEMAGYKDLIKLSLSMVLY